MNRRNIRILTLIACICVACENSNDKSNDLTFPVNIFSSENETDEFYRGVVTNGLNELQEKSLSIDGEAEFRLTVFPSNSNKFSIRVGLDQRDSSVQLVYKRLEMDGTTHKEIDIFLSKKVGRFENPEAYSRIYKFVNQMEFWDLNNEWQCDGADGKIYVLEGVENGQYHLICRWSPEVCKFYKWQEFIDFVNFLLELKSIS